MDAEQLIEQIASPALHRSLLGKFSGPYSLGVGQDDAGTKPVLVLMVPHGEARSFPSSVSVAGELVDVVVRRDFDVPVRQAGTRVAHDG